MSVFIALLWRQALLHIKLARPGLDKINLPVPDAGRRSVYSGGNQHHRFPPETGAVARGKGTMRALQRQLLYASTGTIKDC
ncbi:hypothetical protein [Paracoccus aerius]|uniref:Uncharacterized protein n=1 Tax=Paracoccus aerius TaxID=1915382 RepID=A0ABS1S1L9_9RHOB|nr:hypothetical protein [Paracoccus aerius]MBL3672606.1 hypothetical protein [Paracoccus aerius]